MSAKGMAEAVLLGGTVLSCWVGAVGMLRMRTPTEALHFLSFPTCVASVLLTVAVWIETGVSATSGKTALIAVLLLGINAVGAHAAARAFRTREVGHWRPLPEDGIERATPDAQETAS